MAIDDGRERGETNLHRSEIYPALNDFEYRRNKVRKPRTHDIVGRFSTSVLEEFLSPAFR